MYGCLPAELTGQPAGSLVPDGLRAAHVSQRAGIRRASGGLPGCQDHEDIRGRMRAGRRQRVPSAAGRRFRGAYHGA
jgi:hypothetical protein